ncbi:MAG: ABC transporter permease [Butyrivibrio sp.]|nr:ABC transporter permease [Butyrivibrio sp.]
MLKKHLLLLFFHIKSTFRSMPRLIICTAVFAVAVIALGICGNAILGRSMENTVNVKVAAVIPEGDSDIALAFKLIANMDSLKSVCEFETLDIDAALKKLDRGELSAIIQIPEGFIDSLMYGSNTPGNVIVPENAGMESMLFCSLIGAGAQFLSYSEAGIYAVGDLLRMHDFSSAASSAQDSLYDYYIAYTLNRGGFFKSEPVSATGNLSAVGYYICSGIVLMLLLGGMTAADRFSNRPAAVTESLRASGISRTYTKLCELAGVTLMFFALFTALLFAARAGFSSKYIELTPVGILVFLILTASVVSFVMFLCCIADGGLVSVLLMFLSSALMMYASGRIVPSAYLPPAVERIGRLLPAYGWCRLAESVISGEVNRAALVMSVCYGLFFTFAGIAVTVIKGRDR